MSKDTEERLAAIDADTKPLYKKILATSGQVDARIGELAGEVVERYGRERPLFVCLLRGGVQFAAKLMFAVAKHDPYFHPELDFMTIKTYGDGHEAKRPQIVVDVAPNTQVSGRTVVLLDDVLDTGVTAAFAKQHFIERAAASVELIVLSQKDKPRTEFRAATMFGFAVPTDWLTGMGMDDAAIAPEANRWMCAIAVAADSEPES